MHYLRLLQITGIFQGISDIADRKLRHLFRLADKNVLNSSRYRLDFGFSLNYDENKVLATYE
jgi:hypothetical protein